ncbi:MAG: type VI secretion system tube protein Hcp [Sphingomonadaceae bacterium]
MTNLTQCLSRISAAVALSFALATAPGFAGGYLKLGDIKGESSDARGGEQIELLSWSFGTSRAASIEKVAGMSEIKAERHSSKAGSAGSAQTVTIGSDRSERTSGLPTGKRQHRPMIGTKPAAEGSLTAVIPAGLCKVGARYQSAELDADGRVYRMSDVVVTSCSPASAGGGGEVQPVETISLNYVKIQW